MTKNLSKEKIADLRYRRALRKLTKFLNHWIYLILAATITLTFIGIDTENWRYNYADADGYMRALRVYHFLLNPSFFEQPIIESNYPFGETIHWTRPMDILWLINMLPFSFISDLTNLKDIIFLSGAFISPWLFVITTLILAYGLKKQFNIYLTLMGCGIFISDLASLSIFNANKPDHHSLMTLLSIYALSLVLCWLKKRHVRYLRLLGIALGIATFTAIEGFIIYSLFLAYFIVLYIYKNLSLKPTVTISLTFALTLTGCWLLNPPYEGWLYPDNGRISILFVTLSWLIYGALAGLHAGKLHTRSLKIWCLICASLTIALILVLCFGPQIYQFPLEEETRFIWSNRIIEMRTIFEQSWDKICAFYIIEPISLILALFMIKKKTYNRLALLALCLGVPLFILQLMAHRFAAYHLLFIIIPWLCLLDYLYKKSDYAHHKTFEQPAYIWAIALGYFVVQQLLYLPETLVSALSTERTIIFSNKLCQTVQQIGGTLVTDSFLSPRYVWSCNVNTIATPYHRNRLGLIEQHKILYSTKDSELIPILLRHQVTQILLFTNYDKKYYNMDEENKDKLYYRLMNRQNVPPFLDEVETSLPDARLYRIKI